MYERISLIGHNNRNISYKWRHRPIVILTMITLVLRAERTKQFSSLCLCSVIMLIDLVGELMHRVKLCVNTEPVWIFTVERSRESNKRRAGWRTGRHRLCWRIVDVTDFLLDLSLTNRSTWLTRRRRRRRRCNQQQILGGMRRQLAPHGSALLPALLCACGKRAQACVLGHYYIVSQNNPHPLPRFFLYNSVKMNRF